MDVKAPARPDRILRWDGCVNVRDLGGLPLANGGETAYRVVVRGDWLPGLSETGRRALVDYGGAPGDGSASRACCMGVAIDA